MIVVTAAVTLAACGGTSTGPASSSGGPSKVATIAAEVPDSIKSLAPLQIATDATYPPNESINPDTGAIEGWDIDFGKALCKVMGVACTFNNVIFADIIPQLKATNPRYVFSISSWTPTQQREDGGIDFITYYKAGEAWIVKSGGPRSTPPPTCAATRSPWRLAPLRRATPGVSWESRWAERRLPVTRTAARRLASRKSRSVALTSRPTPIPRYCLAGPTSCGSISRSPITR